MTHQRFKQYGFLLPEVPECRIGAWEVKYFTISRVQAQQATMDSMASNFPFRVDPGDYVKLIFHDPVNGPEVVMSNTMMECVTHTHATRDARGNVLVTGLGLGMIAQTLASKDKVKRITVIEKSEEVIALVAPYLHKKVNVIHDDAYTWQPPKDEKFDYAWHDIWHTMDEVNLPEMTKLHRKYGRRAAQQESWFRPEMKKQQRRDKVQLARLEKEARARFGDKAVDEMLAEKAKQ